MQRLLPAWGSLGGTACFGYVAAGQRSSDPQCVLLSHVVRACLRRSFGVEAVVRRLSAQRCATARAPHSHSMNTPSMASEGLSGSPCKGMSDSPTSAAQTPRDKLQPGALVASSVAGSDIVCVKCALQIQPAEVATFGGPRSKQFCHKGCYNAYKSLTRRKTKNKSFKHWWDSLDSEQMQTWFRKNGVEHQRGLKRESTMHFEVAKVEARGDEHRLRHIAIPYSVFLDRGLAKKKTVAEIEVEWKKMLVDDSVKTVEAHGQKCIVEFAGVIMDEVRSDMTIKKCAKTQAVNTLEAAQEANAQAQEALNAQSSQSSRRSAALAAASAGARLTVPDNIVSNLTSMDKLLGEAAFEDSTFYKDLQETQERDRSLAALEHEDDLEVAIWRADNPEAAPVEDDHRLLRNLKLSRERDFADASLGLSVIVSDTKDEHAQLQASLKHAVDLEEQPKLKEQVDLAEGLPKKLDTMLEKLTNEGKSLGKEFMAAESTEAAKDILERLKQAKASSRADVQSERKVLNILRSALKKQEKAVASIGKTSDDQAGQESMDNGSAFTYIIDHLNVEHGASKNCLAELTAAMDLTAPLLYAKKAKQRTDLASKCKVLTAISAWLSSQFQDQTLVATCVLERRQHLDPILSIVKDTTPEKCQDLVFAKPYSTVHDLKDPFAFHIDEVKKGHNSCGFRPFGCAQWLLVLRGTLVIYGLKPESVPGASYGMKINAMTNMVTDDVAKHLGAAPAFYMIVHAGSLVRLPAGFLVASKHTTDGTILRWSTMDPVKEEVRKVLSTCTSMLASYPSLSSSLKPWVSYLQANA